MKWRWVGALVSLLLLAWVLWRVDLDRLRQVVVEAEIGYALRGARRLAVLPGRLGSGPAGVGSGDC